MLTVLVELLDPFYEGFVIPFFDHVKERSGGILSPSFFCKRRCTATDFHHDVLTRNLSGEFWGEIESVHSIVIFLKL